MLKSKIERTIQDAIDLSQSTAGVDLEMENFFHRKQTKTSVELTNDLVDIDLKVERDISDPGIENDQKNESEDVESVGERRLYVRKALINSILVRVNSSELTTVVSGYLGNLSLSGVGLVTQSEILQNGGVADLKIVNGSDSITMKVLVVKKDLFELKSRYYLYGLRIIQMNAMTRSYIESLLAEGQVSIGD